MWLFSILSVLDPYLHEPKYWLSEARIKKVKRTLLLRKEVLLTHPSRRGLAGAAVGER